MIVGLPSANAAAKATANEATDALSHGHRADRGVPTNESAHASHQSGPVGAIQW